MPQGARSATDGFVRCNTKLARLAAGGAPFPDARILLGVHDGDDEDNSGIHAIENRVWEALNESSAEITIDDRSNLGIHLYLSQRDAQVITKSLA